MCVIEMEMAMEMETRMGIVMEMGIVFLESMAATLLQYMASKYL